MEDALETQVRCLVFGAEEVGLFGAYHWAETHDMDAVKCIFNMDGAGYSRTADVYTHGFDPMGEAFAEVRSELDVSVDIQHFNGIRPAQRPLAVRPEGRRGHAGAVHRGAKARHAWGHTHGDTLDKLDVRDLRDLAVVFTAGVCKLAEADREIPHKSVAEVRDGDGRTGIETGMRNSKTWPFDDGETAGAEPAPEADR